MENPPPKLDNGARIILKYSDDCHSDFCLATVLRCNNPDEFLYSVQYDLCDTAFEYELSDSTYENEWFLVPPHFSKQEENRYVKEMNDASQSDSDSSTLHDDKDKHDEGSHREANKDFELAATILTTLKKAPTPDPLLTSAEIVKKRKRSTPVAPLTTPPNTRRKATGLEIKGQLRCKRTPSIVVHPRDDQTVQLRGAQLVRSFPMPTDKAHVPQEMPSYTTEDILTKLVELKNNGYFKGDEESFQKQVDSTMQTFQMLLVKNNVTDEVALQKVEDLIQKKLLASEYKNKFLFAMFERMKANHCEI